ncbi:uncharacterized protein LOC128565772 [Nycticebus coucang]|uniref:uncharacterized protein LOC128565772 n=1 Tax=Nycticebus coucang TaxID=9470 RepID=UPI00234CBE04|nr:uncharacterized protein LOC128565772 [Nycticebus coucang]
MPDAPHKHPWVARPPVCLPACPPKAPPLSPHPMTRSLFSPLATAWAGPAGTGHQRGLSVTSLLQSLIEPVFPHSGPGGSEAWEKPRFPEHPPQAPGPLGATCCCPDPPSLPSVEGSSSSSCLQPTHQGSKPALSTARSLGKCELRVEDEPSPAGGDGFGSRIHPKPSSRPGRRGWGEEEEALSRDEASGRNAPLRWSPPRAPLGTHLSAW